MDSKQYDPAPLIRSRKYLQKTQQQIADAVNVDRQTIYRAEAGKDVSFNLLVKLCTLYELPVTAVVRANPEIAAA